MTIVEFTAKSGAKPSPKLLLPKPKIVDVLIDADGRAKIVQHIVDIARELLSRADRVDFWEALVTRFRSQAAQEGAALDVVDRAIGLLNRDVQAENAARRKRAVDAALIDPLSLFDFDLPARGQILRFPGEPDVTADELMMPPQLR